MRWLLVSALLLVTVIEGVLLVNWPILGVKLPLTWLAIYLIISNEWVGWRQGLLLTVMAGFTLDALVAPQAGSVMVPLILAWLVAEIILTRYKRTRDAKQAAFSVGSLIYLSGSFVVGPYIPGVIAVLTLMATYLAVCIIAFWVINTGIKFWMSRI